MKKWAVCFIAAALLPLFIFTYGRSAEKQPVKVEAVDYSERGSTTPGNTGYTSWVGLAQLADGTLRVISRR